MYLEVNSPGKHVCELPIKIKGFPEQPYGHILLCSLHFYICAADAHFSLGSSEYQLICSVVSPKLSFHWKFFRVIHAREFPGILKHSRTKVPGILGNVLFLGCICIKSSPFPCCYCQLHTGNRAYKRVCGYVSHHFPCIFAPLHHQRAFSGL